VGEKAGWGFAEGDEIVPGRFALKKLGGGKRYEAYLAWDEKLFSQVVVKVLRPDRAQDESAVGDLGREADALERLKHPMLVRGFDAVLKGPRPHIVLEFFEGPTLRKLIKGYGPLQLEQVVPLAVKVCGALHYMASEEMVHLDVKPGNIVMEAPPKLIDLSVARTTEAAAKLRKRVGTRSYMSPEQCRAGEGGRIGPPSDVWGAGATLYEAITGTRAFPSTAENGTDDDSYPQLTEDPPPFPARTPAAVAELVMSCLQKDPDRRPSAAEVARGFEPLLSEIPDQPRLRRGRPKLR
jgi:eukaryotic-like serine/threonine-protein kinase